MYLCRVLTGDYTTGQQNMIVPPQKDTGQKYDSVVDNVAKPSIFVIFHDSHAYPEYLITFKWHSQILRYHKKSLTFDPALQQ